MSANLLLLIWVQSALLLGGVWVACRLVKSPVVRQWLCRGGLLGVAGLALAAPLVGNRKESLPAVPFNPILVRTPVTPPTPQPAEDRPIQARPADVEPGQAEPVAKEVAVATTWDTEAALTAVWQAGVAIFALHALIGLCLLAMLHLKSRPCGNARVLAVAESCRGKLGLRRLRVRETTGSATPFVAGIVGPAIYVAEGWAEGQPDDAMAAFFCHEAGHVARRDLAWTAFHRLTQIVLWPQPFVWLLGKPMSLASEELCDRQVIAAGAEPAGYADRLLRLVETKPQKVWAIRYGFGIAHSRSALGRRLEAIMHGTNLSELRISRRARWGLASLLVASVAVATLAFAVPQNHAREPWAMEPPPQGVKTIKILTPDGKPATEARAWLIVDPGARPANPIKRIPVTNGTARVDFSESGAKVQDLVVEAKGFGLTFERRWPSENPSAGFVLRGATKVAGRLLLPNGRPASGIRVFPTMLICRGPRPADFAGGDLPPVSWLVFNDPDMRKRYTAVTDAAGKFTIGGLPRGATLALDTDDRRFAQFPYATRGSTGNSAATKVKDITLVPAATIEGRVRRAGQPVEGIVVGCQGDTQGGGEAITGADGRYRIERVEPAKYNVALNLAEPLSGEVTAVAHEGVVLKPGDHRTGYDFDLIPGALIKGRVTFADGSPVGNAPVGVYGPARPRSGAWVQGTQTDKDGYYKLRVPAGEQYVYVMVEGGASETVTVKDGEERTVDFTTR